MDIVLIAGLWLPSDIWDDTVAALADRGLRGVAVRLPGVDDGNRGATLDDQLDAVLAAVDRAERPLVVGHSAASTLAWLAADRSPGAVRGVALVGGMPSGDGTAYIPWFDAGDDGLPFPGWEPFAGPDSADLGPAERDRIASGAVTVPAGVARGVVHLGDDRRYDVPIAMVCPEYTPEQARAWVAAGEIPELARATRVSYVDLASGHWPMVSCPAELARVLVEIATGL